jgi:hypothetical protein
LTERRNVNKPNKVIQQKQESSSIRPLSFYLKKNESIKEKKCNLRHLGVILDISSGFHLNFQQLTI